jgi:murein tripeptide amidase MpaA
MPAPSRVRPRLAVAGLASLALSLAALPSAVAGPLDDLAGTASSTVDETASAAEAAFAPQLVTVQAETRELRNLVASSGLDVTEHAGHDYIEVVLHTPADLDLLESLGLPFDVRIADLVARGAEIRAANDAYAASTDVSPLPSGRTTYRTLPDYEVELQQLAADHEGLVRHFTLPHATREGKAVHGIEIAADVDATDDGRPTMLMMGLHHAREWPSGEHTIEFAHDLVNGFGTDPRITDLLERARVVVVPVVNPDGFEKSVNDGLLVDLREVDGGGTVSILATPANTYKRKNCGIDGLETTPPLLCDAAKSPGGFGVGVDLNRNYGAFHGGPGASDNPADPTYHGPHGFSEPETQNVRELVRSRHVTMLITNHTFSNLVLRPNGVNPTTIGPDGMPVGDAPDEDHMKAIGADMVANNGYSNQHGWELYDTTGTTEDWSYNATGGFGYTFEIGPDEFHPPYPEVIDEYLGAGQHAGKGNREAYLVALEAAVDPGTHAVLTGRAPKGATLRLTRGGSIPTWDGSFEERVEVTVDADGRFTWHVNPSTRPIVMSRRAAVLGEEPVSTRTWEQPAPAFGSHADTIWEVPDGVDAAQIRLDWPVPDDLDLEVYRQEADGSLTLVGSSGNIPTEKEQVLLVEPAAGTYVLRVINFLSITPTYTLTAATYETDEVVTPGLVEAWTLTCEVGGEVLQRSAVVVDRGDRSKVDLRECEQAARRR